MLIKDFQMLTQAELKRQLHYDHETGVFTWLVTNSRRAITGSIAGKTPSNGYISIQVNKVRYMAHRLAWLYVYGYMPKDFIDHINNVRHDNRISNLREASKSQNGMNRPHDRDNQCRAKGVSLHKKTGKFVARIKYAGKQISLGYYFTKDAAGEAYELAEKMYFKEFSYSNSQSEAYRKANVNCK